MATAKNSKKRAPAKKPAARGKAASRAAPRQPPAPAKKAAKTTAKKPSKKRPKKAAKTATKRAAKVAKPAEKGRAKKPTARPAPPVVRVVKVKQLDPIAKCGPATSVEQLFRVDEELDGRPTVHLVFFDRHGWYCVHGPRCAAVADVHSHNRTLHGARPGGR